MIRVEKGFNAMFEAVKRFWNTITAPQTIEEYVRDGNDSEPIPVASSANPATALQQATVMACVKLIANNIARLPLHLYKRVGNERTEATDHPLYSVLRKEPNSFQSAYEFFQFMVTSMLLNGMGTALIRRAGKQVVSLVPICPSSVQEIWNGNQHYFSITMQDGSHIDADPADVLCIKAFSLDGRYACSLIEYALSTINMSLQAEGHSTKMLENSETPSAVVTSPNPLSEKQIKDFKKNWTINHSGNNVGKISVLWGGMDYKPITISNADAQLLEIMDFKRSDIAAIFGCPPNMVGIQSSSWGTGIAEQKASFLTFTLAPYLSNICQAIQRSCLTPVERKQYYCEFNTNAFLDMALLDRYRAYQIGLGGANNPGIITVNEARTKENLPLLDDPRADEVFIPNYGNTNTNAEASAEEMNNEQATR